MKLCKWCCDPITTTEHGDYCSSDCRNEALVAQLMDAFSTDEEAADLERAMIERGIIDLDDLEAEVDG